MNHIEDFRNIDGNHPGRDRKRNPNGIRSRHAPVLDGSLPGDDTRNDRTEREPNPKSAGNVREKGETANPAGINRNAEKTDDRKKNGRRAAKKTADENSCQNADRILQDDSGRDSRNRHFEKTRHADDCRKKRDDDHAQDILVHFIVNLD